MARVLGSKCRKCRRAGEKLFLKGEKCFTAKCPVVRRNYPPGMHGLTGKRRKITGFGEQLRDKQKAKSVYGLLEAQFRNYVQSAVKKTGNSTQILQQLLEQRLDNVVYRLGFATSRAQARQLVGHGHFSVNNRTVNIPSYQIRVGDVIAIRSTSVEGGYFKQIQNALDKHTPPSWLHMDSVKKEGKVTNVPTLDEVDQTFDSKRIIEYYSRN